VAQPRPASAACHNFGVALCLAGRTKAAIAAYRRALSIYQETGNRTHEGATRDALSRAIDDDNRYTEAERAR